jgi:hypothetical protein
VQRAAVETEMQAELRRRIEADVLVRAKKMICFSAEKITEEEILTRLITNTGREGYSCWMAPVTRGSPASQERDRRRTRH